MLLLFLRIINTRARRETISQKHTCRNMIICCPFFLNNTLKKKASERQNKRRGFKYRGKHILLSSVCWKNNLPKNTTDILQKIMVKVECYLISGTLWRENHKSVIMQDIPSRYSVCFPNNI